MLSASPISSAPLSAFLEEASSAQLSGGGNYNFLNPRRRRREDEDEEEDEPLPPANAVKQAASRPIEGNALLKLLGMGSAKASPAQSKEAAIKALEKQLLEQYTRKRSRAP